MTNEQWLKTLDIVSQIGITILSASFLFLLARQNRAGWICGVLSQPFWFYTTIHNGQWILMVINVIYLANHIYGWYNWHKHPLAARCPHCSHCTERKTT